MDKFEYLSGLPEVGIVPRAPHAGPLLREIYEQEHGRGGFAGKVTHTYHLYPPNNWLRDEARVLDGRAFAEQWESPLVPVGGTHHALAVMTPAEERDVYRGMARLVANETVAMNVTAPAARMDYFFEHHSATLVYFVHEGRGVLETMFGPLEYRQGDFLVLPKGTMHRFELGPGRHYYWMYESFAGDPEKSEAATTGQFITHSRSDYKFPRSLDPRNEAGRFEVISKVGLVPSATIPRARDREEAVARGCSRRFRVPRGPRRSVQLRRWPFGGVAVEEKPRVRARSDERILFWTLTGRGFSQENWRRDE